ncbi:hypothetical protein acsn021_13090 [Anaerocolumna cellulosilytica]|uniref:Uncharacterized protein n=1 Tax=Anaerocolumna cellulosilytica TaxID=433286 RepID=A0A6S6R335_9FIRM|nr:hypothetical protein [Anaerocolumna cellulosilytica]MBB5195962.1 hypothetical protein [Anaerocolumna cellulosilytica]BCJ93740.1 hypothetical protein acsn021_13090 [Anaerocolumna cellulosilytica]
MNKKLFLLLLFVTVTFTSFPNTISKAASHEYAWFPVSVMNITQIAYESYSHSNSNQIDCSGSTYAFAPFTGKVVNISKSYGVVLFQSTNPVYYADGTIDYMTVQFMHGSNYDTWKSYYEKGTVISQGTDFYKIGGTDGNGNTTYGLHYDIGVYRGKTSSFASSFSKFGNTFAFDAFYINTNKTTSIKNKGKVESGNTIYNNAPSNWSNLWRNLSNSSKISVIYQVYDDVTKQFLPNVVDTQDYAGIFGHDIDCLYANLSSGNITYKVHYKGGSWLSEVTNRSDYAGIKNKPIDGLMIKTDTGKTVYYRVHLRRTGKWLPYVTGYNSNDSNNGYSGILGQEIDAIQIYLD